jgi:hypothetical protein
MNEYFALDPLAPQSVRDISDLRRIFSPDTGRFLYSIPESWQEEFVNNMRQVSDSCGTAAEEFLRGIVLLPRSTRVNKKLKWDEIAIELFNDTKAILGQNELKPHVRALNEALCDMSLWQDASEGHVDRTAQSYAAIAEPILRTSTKVSLVDPYFRLRYRVPNSTIFRLSDRHADTLRFFIQCAARHRRVKVFCLFINEDHALELDPSGERFKSDLMSIRDQVEGAGSILLEYKKLSRASPIDSHPRYLLGHKLGLKFDWGFESFRKDPGTQHLSWIGRRALEPLLDRFL